MTLSTVSRRSLIKSALVGLAAIPVIVCPSRAEAAVLEASDPQAKALGFVTDAAAVDPKANPKFAAGQNCASCSQYKGKPTDATAPCVIFSMKTVPAAGWCKVWAKRTA